MDQAGHARAGGDCARGRADGRRCPEIPGLDLGNALARVGGNAALLRKLIVRFHDTQGGVIGRIRTAMEGLDLKTAVREAHTLKGLAGNIGATELARHAAQVESMLGRGETGGIAAAMTTMATELDDLLARIGAGIETPGQAAPAPGFPPDSRGNGDLKGQLLQA